MVCSEERVWDGAVLVGCFSVGSLRCMTTGIAMGGVVGRTGRADDVFDREGGSNWSVERNVLHAC